MTSLKEAFENCQSWQDLQKMSIIDPSSRNRDELIIHCRGMMGWYSNKKETCMFCRKIREKEYLLPHYHVAQEVWAHYDCVPCDVCQKCVADMGLTLTQTGEKYHAKCKPSVKNIMHWIVKPQNSTKCQDPVLKSTFFQ